MSDADNGRQCYICLDTSPPDDAVWVHPCRCTGTMAWVHKRCVLRWVRTNKLYNCPQCLTPYRITPYKSSLLLALEYIDNTIYPSVKAGVAFLVCCVGVDLVCTALGLFAFIQAYGVDDTIVFLSSSDTTDTLARLHLVSYSLLTINSVSWEDYFLKSLQYAGKVPLLNLFLPAYTSRRTLFMFRKPSVSRIVAGSVMLPIFGRLCGQVFFKHVHNQLTRVILGGVSYLVVKGGVYMYFTQKLLVRLDRIAVLPHLSHRGSPVLSTIHEGSEDQATQEEQQQSVEYSRDHGGAAEIEVGERQTNS